MCLAIGRPETFRPHLGVYHDTPEACTLLLIRNLLIRFPRFLSMSSGIH
jgi:hypothetical protein